MLFWAPFTHIHLSTIFSILTSLIREKISGFFPLFCTASDRKLSGGWEDIIGLYCCLQHGQSCSCLSYPKGDVLCTLEPIVSKNLPIIQFQISTSFSLLFQLIFSHYSCSWSFTTDPTLTLGWQVTVNTPLPHEIRQSWGLQSIKHRSHRTWWSFVDTRASFVDTRRSSSPIDSAMRYTWSKYHAGSDSMLLVLFSLLVHVV